jgi:hypothetical protein
MTKWNQVCNFHVSVLNCIMFCNLLLKYWLFDAARRPSICRCLGSLALHYCRLAVVTSCRRTRCAFYFLFLLFLIVLCCFFADWRRLARKSTSRAVRLVLRCWRQVLRQVLRAEASSLEPLPPWIRWESCIPTFLPGARGRCCGGIWWRTTVFSM